MKNKVWFVVVTSILVGILLQSYWHSGIPYTHDGENHLARFANYKLALKEGQLPPRFAPNLMNRYGYPVFNYNYPLPSIASLPFSFVKVPYSTTFKLLIVLSLMVGSAAIFALGRKYQASLSATLIAESVYLLNPYIVSAILYRGSIGEVMSVALFPWLWWSIVRLKQPTRPIQFAIGILSWAAFFLAHNVGVMLGVPVLIVLALVTYQTTGPAWRRLALMSGMGCLLTLWFWIPALAEKSLVILDSAGLSQTATSHFPIFSQLLFSPIEFGFSFPGYVDSLGFSLGLANVLLLLVLSITWWKRREHMGQHRGLVLGLVILCWGLIFGQLSLSSEFWRTLPAIRFIQFPWRLTLFWAVLISGWSLLAWQHIPRWLQRTIVILLGLQLLTISRLKPVDYRYLSNVDIDNFTQSTTTANENLPKEFSYSEIGDWQPTAKILEGAGQLQIDVWRGSSRTYQLQLTEPSLIAEPTMVFAGWETTVTDGQGSRLVSYENSASIAGRLAYRLPAGEYRVHSEFTQNTLPRQIGNGISGVVAISLIAWLGWSVMGRKDRH